MKRKEYIIEYRLDEIRRCVVVAENEEQARDIFYEDCCARECDEERYYLNEYITDIKEN